MFILVFVFIFIFAFVFIFIFVFASLWFLFLFLFFILVFVFVFVFHFHFRFCFCFSFSFFIFFIFFFLVFIYKFYYGTSRPPCRLKQGYDLRGYFLKIIIETIKILIVAVVNKHLLEAAVQRCSAKKVFLNIHKIYSEVPVPVACNFIEIETRLQMFVFCETFKDNYLIEHLQWLLLVFSFK